ncbi:dipeptidyl-peptidase 7. Serine peptidase. MEROPS family S46 [Singulisphaera sp. GP187]|uniref:S46 family peptidase n=1 Tax=Singulisphaera sp. GP187 TaxID=1882752 RepID=UPI00092B0B05|nr:S46 family peptidase [Singulisphaera sp. GP187]SIO64939.1 dipeptidyl-peptidase 7. Serine peptidase. MEROPS family S46 [Singulisphaera sp. GP187]
MSARQQILALSVISVLCGGGTVVADEGMWVFNNLPLKTLKQRYNFAPTPAWIERLRSSAVRFNSGGSGSFVSADGLVMTNHHVGADMLQKISTAGKNYHKAGFLAKTRADEIKAPDLELNVLVEIQDVTDRVLAAVKPGMGDSEAGTAKRKAMATIEKESLDKSGLRSDVVTLYQGGQYALYTYKKYTDVRLVFAPEFDIAFFGGDPDNFEFPRYDLDVCFFRAYENDKPAQPKHYLSWSAAGSKDGDLIFVAGHPGKTSRLNTVAHLEYLRDVSFPFSLEILHAREAFLAEYGKKGAEHARQAMDELFGYQNSRKAREGGLKGLKDEALMARKREAEVTLRDRIKADHAAQAAYGSAWDKIAAAHQVSTKIAKRFNFLERGFAFDSALFHVARTLVRLAQEQEKPNGDRLREYRESALESLQLALFSDAPIYPEFEEAKLAHSLAFWKKGMGENDPLVARVLHGRTPEAVAKELVGGTKLADVSVRRALAKGGLKALLELDDPMIKLALAIDADARTLRTQYEDEVEDVLSAQYAGISKATFEAQGDSVYPDATFTLRLAFGTVKGYEAGGKFIPPYTTIGGAFKHADAHGNTTPYVIPPSWHQAKQEGRLNLETAMNFVSTADIIGGNSGSPVVNRDNEVVGLIFDGNVDSLVLDFAFDDRSARAISVDSRAIFEALKSVYHAEELAGELMGKH